MEKYNLRVEDNLNVKYYRKLEKPVMSLSRMPNKAEVHSWRTELEIAAGIVLKNTQDRASHWCAASVKIYTDHKSFLLNRFETI